MKKYIAILGSVGVLALALVAVTPALAAGPQGQGGQGGGWGMGGGGGMQMQGMRPGVSGSVTAVNGSTLTVTSRGFNGAATTTYAVDASNATVMKNNATSSVASIATGDRVMVQGTVSGTNVTATKIFDGQNRMGMGMRGGPGMAMKPAVVGQVASVSGSVITVNSRGFNAAATTTYTVDATNATVMKDNATSSVGSIAVGDSVAVQGTVSGTNVTATMIRDGMPGRGQGGGPGGQGMTPVQGNGEPVVAGKVSAVNGSTLTITNNGNTSYTIDATNATITKSGTQAATISNIAVGDSVIVQGTVNGNSVVATSVIDQAQGQNQNHPGGFFGMIGQFFKNLFHF